MQLKLTNWPVHVQHWNMTSKAFFDKSQVVILLQIMQFQKIPIPTPRRLPQI